MQTSSHADRVARPCCLEAVKRAHQGSLETGYQVAAHWRAAVLHLCSGKAAHVKPALLVPFCHAMLKQGNPLEALGLYRGTGWLVQHLQSCDVPCDPAGAYSFAFPRQRDGVYVRYLLPLLGSMNHAGPAQANTRVKQDRSTGAFLVTARRDIAKGTEVRMSRTQGPTP